MECTYLSSLEKKGGRGSALIIAWDWDQAARTLNCTAKIAGMVLQLAKQASVCISNKRKQESL